MSALKYGPQNQTSAYLHSPEDSQALLKRNTMRNLRLEKILEFTFFQICRLAAKP